MTEKFLERRALFYGSQNPRIPKNASGTTEIDISK